MRPIIVYVVSGAAALVFELAYAVYSRKYGQPASKSEWCVLFWSSGFLLAGICLMSPYDARTFVEFSPMFMLASFHVQQAHQGEVIEKCRIQTSGSAASKP